LSNNNYNDFNKLAQQYGLKHKVKQYLTPSGWGRGIAEHSNSSYKDKMDILRTQDQLMRDIVLGNNGDQSFKSLLGSANIAFKEDRYLDVTHWLYTLSGSVKKMIEAGAEVHDLSPEQLGEAYSDYTDADLDKDFFQDANDGFISNAGVMDYLGKMFGGSQIEKMYWKKIRERKIAVQALLRSADTFFGIVNQTLDVMGTARAQGSIASWLTGYQRIVKEYNKFYSGFKSIFETHLKELVDLAKKKKDAEKQLADQNNKKRQDERTKIQPSSTTVPANFVSQDIDEQPDVVEVGGDVSSPNSGILNTIEQVPDEIIINEDDFKKQEFKSRPPTEKELEESARRQKLVADEEEEKLVNKLVSLIKAHPEKRDEYIAMYEAGDFSFLEDEKNEVIVDKNIKPAIEKSITNQNVIETVQQEVLDQKETNKVEEPMSVDQVLNDEPLEVAPEEIPEIIPEVKEKLKESPRDLAQEIVNETSNDFDDASEEDSEEDQMSNKNNSDITPSFDKKITLVMLPKHGLDNMEEEKVKLEKQLGTEVAFVTEKSAEMVGGNYLNDNYDVDVKSYTELTKTNKDLEKNVANLDDPDFIKSLPRLGNGKIWIGKIMDEMFNHLSKKEQGDVKNKLVKLNESIPETSTQTQPVPVTTKTNPIAAFQDDALKVENHTKALESLYDKPFSEIKENVFNLLKDPSYIELLPTNKDGLFDFNLINKFPEAIYGGNFFITSLSAYKNKKDLLDQMKPLNTKSSFYLQILKIANNKFFDDLKNVSSKKEMITKLCAHSELIDTVDPQLSIRLLQQAVKLNND